MSENIQYVSLTQADYEKLKSEKTGIITPLLLAALLGFVPGVAIFMFMRVVYCPLILIIFGGTMLLGGIVGQGKDKKIKQDMAQGKKQIITAPISAQDIKVTEHTRRRNRSAAAEVLTEAFDSPTTEMEYEFWIQVQNHRVVVSEEEYYKHKKGDLVEIHVAPHSGVILSDVIKKV